MRPDQRQNGRIRSLLTRAPLGKPMNQARVATLDHAAALYPAVLSLIGLIVSTHQPRATYRHGGGAPCLRSSSGFSR